MTDKVITPDLKRKITERWKPITMGSPEERNKALAQLEYILLEAGLLAQSRTRKPKHEDILT